MDIHFLPAWMAMIYTKCVENKAKIINFCFYSYYALLIIAKSYGYNSGDFFYKICFYVGAVLLLIKLFNTRYTFREYALLLIFLGIVGIIYLKLGDLTALLLLITVAGMKECNFLTVIKMTAIIRLLTLTGQLLMVGIGIIDVQRQLADPSDVNSRVLYALGWNKPNSAFLSAFLTVVVIMYLYYDKLNIWHLLLTSVPMIILFRLTYCRTGMILFLGLWVLIFLEKVTKNKKYYKVFCLSYAGAFLLSYLSVRYYQSTSEVSKVLNHLFSGRIDIMKTYYSTVGLSLFPRDISVFSFYSNRIIDNLYMSITITSGILSGILFVFLLTKLMFWLYKNMFYKEIIFMVIFAAYAMLEQFPLNPSMNPFILLLAVLLYGNKVMIGEKKIE